MVIKRNIILVTIILCSNTIYGQLLIIDPPSLSLQLHPGRLITVPITIRNSHVEELFVQATYDIRWITLQPDKFTLSPGESIKIQSIYFISDGTSADRKGIVSFFTNKRFIYNKMFVICHHYATHQISIQENLNQQPDSAFALRKERMNQNEEKLENLYTSLLAGLATEIGRKKMNLNIIDGKVKITLKTENLFQDNKVSLNEEGSRLLLLAGNLLKDKMPVEFNMQVKCTQGLSFDSDRDLSNEENLFAEASSRAETITFFFDQIIGLNCKSITKIGQFKNHNNNLNTNRIEINLYLDSRQLAN